MNEKTPARRQWIFNKKMQVEKHEMKNHQRKITQENRSNIRQKLRVKIQHL
jgi:hypothetical protein